MSTDKYKFPSKQNINDLFNYFVDKQYDDAEKLAISLTKKFPEHQFSWKVLGEIFRIKKKLSNALRAQQISIKINAQDHEAHNNLGITLKDIGKLEDAKISFQKAIELNSDFDDAYYNLGKILYQHKDYKRAGENFLLSNLSKSKTQLLKCKFMENDKYGFYKQLDYLVEKNQINSVIGSLVNRSKIKFGINRKNTFCNNPLEYVYKIDLTERCDFENIFVKTIKNILNVSTISYRKQNLLTNGIQTSGNILQQNHHLINEIRKIIYSQIEIYRTHFKDSEEGFIKNWPSSYDISAWLIKMKNGGKLKPHMHESGWLSGSIYINVPPKLETNSGNLVVCIDEKESDVNFNSSPTKKIIDVVTGNLCLFPSSLLHYTIPFESAEERIVLAFDVNPK